MNNNSVMLKRHSPFFIKINEPHHFFRFFLIFVVLILSNRHLWNRLLDLKLQDIFSGLTIRSSLLRKMLFCTCSTDFQTANEHNCHSIRTVQKFVIKILVKVCSRNTVARMDIMGVAWVRALKRPVN